MALDYIFTDNTQPHRAHIVGEFLEEDIRHRDWQGSFEVAPGNLDSISMSTGLRINEFEQMVNFATSKNKSVHGLPELSGLNKNCIPCKLAKSRRVSFKPIGKIRSKRALELLHMDLCGPLPVASQGVNRLLLVFKERAERFLNKKEISVRTDRGLEFCSGEFRVFLEGLGIDHEKTNSYSPEMNGVAERYNLTALDGIKTLLNESGISQKFWAEVICFSYTWNRICHKGCKKTPFELYGGKRPSISHLKRFGCLAFVGVPKQLGRNLDMRAKLEIMLGYALSTKGYRIWLIEENKVIETIKVRFDEGKRGVDSQKTFTGPARNYLLKDFPEDGDIFSAIGDRADHPEAGSERDTRPGGADSESQTGGTHTLRPCASIFWIRKPVERKDRSRTDIYYFVEGSNVTNMIFPGNIGVEDDTQDFQTLHFGNSTLSFSVPTSTSLFNFGGKNSSSGKVRLTESPIGGKSNLAEVRIPKIIERPPEQLRQRIGKLSNDLNVDFIVLNNKLSTVKEIIEEISQLKCAYFNLPEKTDFKDAFDVTIDLQAEAQEVEENDRLGNGNGLNRRNILQVEVFYFLVLKKLYPSSTLSNCERRRIRIAAIESVDRNIAPHENIMQEDLSNSSLKEDEAFLKNVDTLKEIKNRMVSELRTIPPCLDPDCTDHTIISKENEPTLDNSKPNDKKKPRKRKSKKQDSEGFAFPTKSSRPTTPTLVPEPIPTQNNFENLTQEPEPMIDSNQENTSPIIKPPYPITLKTAKNYRDQLKKISENFPNISIKTAGDYIKLFPKTEEEKGNLVNFLELDKNYQFYVTQPKANKPLKVVLKGLPRVTLPEVIQIDLEALGYTIISCWNTLDKTLRSFWETENLSEEQPIISDELSYCEKHFEKTHFRKPCGRYSVSLPFKENIQENVNLGDFRSIASKRLDQLWRRLDSDPKLNNLYTKFIEEYLSLDHMEEITNIDDIASEGFFLLHHGVLRAGNRSRPLRVVFNGSQKTDLDISLNDVLYKGGVIQDDLFSIMLRARKHAYFFSCDISHMFRQMEIHPHQRHFQKILWKKGLNEPVQIFKFRTVTYGTTPACYLSTRVLKQLSLDERENFPKVADIVLHDVYLDDILSGCSSLNELESLMTELPQLFKRAGMSLHKWCFSHSTNNFSDLHFDQSCEESITKTLGLLWNSSSDTFCFSFSFDQSYLYEERCALPDRTYF
ncbi:retrovirus-related Pol polyprotein from transposon TNT 1-94 [Trichonephila clavipes]|nr:retrovirus-related Pol polyprotein from transposon TNT 1-94 [Trichonephila clavipes]